MKKGKKSNLLETSLIVAALFVFPALQPETVFAQKGLIEDKHVNIFNELASGFACLCGCGSTVKSCPHKKCGFATPLKKELTQMILDGFSKEQIIEYFVAKHGDRLLAAPPKRGWYLVGYFLPAFLIIVFGFLIKRLITKWASIPRTVENETAQRANVDNHEDEEYAKRLKNELEDFETK
ncbi:MAG: cytochrome c-type biogenesis protein CcmH [Nitrospinota bacterium]